MTKTFQAIRERGMGVAIPEDKAVREQAETLLAAAAAAAQNAYAPYSGFRVGAAVWADGKVFTGANVENASYGLSLCAERSALAAAVAAGARRVRAVAVHCADAGGEGACAIAPEAAMPCGACRQWLAELAPDAWLVSNSHPEPLPVAELLPLAFRLPRQDSPR